MNNNEYIQLLPGFFQGITRVAISYPFDYLRLTLQTSKEKTIISSFKNNYKNLYRGLFFPLLTVPFDRAITFYMYEKLKTDNYKPFLSSLIPSMVSNIYMTPINLLNSNYIFHNKTELKNLFKKNFNKKIYSGYNIEIIRNTSSSFLFLYSYDICKKYFDSSFLNGSLSSLIMWSFLYPLDTIKARKFIYKQPYHVIIKTILIKDLYKGISLVYLKTIPSAGFGMYVYEYIKNKISN